jgi:inhibitor of nuclear factor kappa-B kinase subunit alpha
LTFFSDEAWFHMQGYINMQNNRYWSSQNSHLTHKVLLYPVKVGVWCAVRAIRIVGPVFFKETINCKRRVQDILRQFSSELTEEKRLYGWFQQDSAIAYTARMSMQALSDIFRYRIVSSGIWPACSPDLNPCDFFLWGCFKDKVYNSNPRTEEELKENIRREIANIPAEQLQRINQNLFHWCAECLHVEGRHFQHLL